MSKKKKKQESSGSVPQNGSVEEAVLSDGRRLPFIRTASPPRGMMKHTFFTPDKSYVVQFFNDPAAAQDGALRDRIKAIMGRFNPTISEQNGGATGNTDKTASYFEKLFCWPVAIVESPEFGIVCPTYPKNFFFGPDAANGKGTPKEGADKSSRWFTTQKARKYLRETELGTLKSMMEVSLNLSRAVRRMHSAGLAHSDLSHKNVLIDPPSGGAVVIDIDSLVVPGLYPPEVAGTGGYMAPEVLATIEYDRNDKRRKLPCIETDLHALPVLIYQYLLHRHPLEGPKIYSLKSTEDDDFLGMGAMATFIENPYDTSNRPPDLETTIDDLGSGLKRLFIQAFVDGLHNPPQRPAAAEWERELDRTIDLLHPCDNPSCPQKWFVMSDPWHAVCPFCGTEVKPEDRIQLMLKRPDSKPGLWRSSDRTVTLHDGMHLYAWHVFSNQKSGEKASTEPQAKIMEHSGRWYLVNENIDGLFSPRGNLVPKGQAIALDDGVVFRMSEKGGGRLAQVRRGR